MAPVAGYSDYAFRSVCYEGGADLAYTEMVSTEALTRSSEKTASLMQRSPNEKNLAVQIFGGVEKTMADAALIVLKTVKPQLIDINCGCPVPKIVKTGAGSSLTRDPDKLYKIVKAVTGAVTEAGSLVPVTVKIRSGWDAAHLTWKEAASAAVEAGAKAVTLHARTKAQGYEGKSDWGILKELSDYLKKINIPVFGSGDVFSPEDAKRMLETTGCSGVMFARGAMGNPFIFGQTRQLLQTGKYDEIPLSVRLKAGMKELRMLSESAGELNACREMRKRFCAYTKGFPGVSMIRKMVVSAESIKDYEQIEILANKVEKTRGNILL